MMTMTKNYVNVYCVSQTFLDSTLISNAVLISSFFQGVFAVSVIIHHLCSVVNMFAAKLLMHLFFACMMGQVSDVTSLDAEIAPLPRHRLQK